MPSESWNRIHVRYRTLIYKNYSCVQKEFFFRDLVQFFIYFFFLYLTQISMQWKKIWFLRVQRGAEVVEKFFFIKITKCPKKVWVFFYKLAHVLKKNTIKYRVSLNFFFSCSCFLFTCFVWLFFFFFLNSTSCRRNSLSPHCWI